MERKVTYAPAPGPGVWRKTPPNFADPLLPQWAGLTPFAIAPDNRLRPKDPPRLGESAYTTAYKEVKEIGAANSKTRSREQTEIARFWADDIGTVTPPGHWNQIAQTVVRQRDTSLDDSARLFALLNMALADAGILCWDCKYKFGLWRPVTAIRDADQNINPETAPDRDWMPLLVTPPFPSYVSGHSTFSGAAAAVLTDFFGEDVPFRTVSEGLPGVTRVFGSFEAAAEEAGQSRIYGGIHWQFDNQEGLALGKAIGSFVCRRYLLARTPEQKLRSTGSQ
jgi:membrane-associated phospholipid phosphatase